MIGSIELRQGIFRPKNMYSLYTVGAYQEALDKHRIPGRPEDVEEYRSATRESLARARQLVQLFTGQLGVLLTNTEGIAYQPENSHEAQFIRRFTLKEARGILSETPIDIHRLPSQNPVDYFPAQYFSAIRWEDGFLKFPDPDKYFQYEQGKVFPLPSRIVTGRAIKILFGPESSKKPPLLDARQLRNAVFNEVAAHNQEL